MSRATELAPRLLHHLSAPPPRPLALRGRSGAGKTTLLRQAIHESGREAAWASAVEVVGRLAESVRTGRYEVYRAAFVSDGRPLCLEHLEDLRRKPMARAELRRLLEERARRGHPVVLTLTSATGDTEVVEWLESWTELVLLE